MTFIYIIILGIIQGIAEFLPISSSGHLVFLSQILNIDINFMFLSILLHVATLLSIFVVMRKEIIHLILNPKSSLCKKVLLSFLPTMLVVFILKTFLENSFTGGAYLSVTFLITAILLLISQFYFSSNSKKPIQNQGEISTKTAIIMGFAQGIACFPGLSRSGTTISAGLICGSDREGATKFSFLMAIPVIVASFLYDLIFNFNEIQIASSAILPVIISFVLCFLIGIFSLKFMLKYLKVEKYYLFSIYLTLISVLNSIITIFI